MKLLAIARPRPGVDAQSEIARHAREELQALWKLYRNCDVREMYSPGGPGVVLILEAPAKDAAEAILAQLPLVVSEIVAFELLELRPFSALEMLFSDSES